jgi:Ni/Fe-hydrogenase subunit HybB-like protein/Fe-S-cluster-containing dehydrogenase component
MGVTPPPEVGVASGMNDGGGAPRPGVIAGDSQMPITRRVALQTLAAAGTTALLPDAAWGRARREAGEGAVGVLYDPTLCVGCRDCAAGCAVQNGCDEATARSDGADLSPDTLTVLRCVEEGGAESFHKVQCMHCVDPACVSACMLGAMRKNADGSVTWNGDLCVGCRYCQIGCPYNVLRFEWDTPLPKLTKCELCPERRAAGQLPACVEKCKRGALEFGLRRDLLVEAHRRIAEAPERYGPEVYGEHEGGGTSFLYLRRAEVSFAAAGLPALGPKSVPHLPETIQHTLYKGFAAPLALLAVLGMVVRRNAGRLHAAEATEDHAHEKLEPVGGRIVTWPAVFLSLLILAGLAAVAWRFAVGLGPTTNLSDGYPMGIWIAFDVVTGTALACGGYAVALLVYLLNKGRYHPLVRGALVTSALGYTLGGMSVLIDLGRAWNFYKIPVFFWEWNFNSILLEVALCIMLYTTVLWIEVSPAFFERWQESRLTWLQRVATAVSPRLEKALPYAIAVGLLLPTMHQSSLGSMMLLAGEKLHPLWSTPMLPLLFLVSCVGMGYAAVTLEGNLAAKAFKRPSELPMLRALGLPVAIVLLLYATLRTIDVTTRGLLEQALLLDFHSKLFLTEMALFVVPALGLLVWRRRASGAFLTAVATLVIFGGGLYRFSTFLIAFDPGPQWSYFPSVAEFAVTIGLVAGEILAYVVLVKLFPVLRGAAPAAARPGGDPGQEAVDEELVPALV